MRGNYPSWTTPFNKRQGYRLPHWTAQGATYHVVFREADSIPADKLAQLKEELDLLEQTEKKDMHQQARWEKLTSDPFQSSLDAGYGECYCRNPGLAAIVHQALLHFDGVRYDLFASCVMPKHVHIILSPYEGFPLPKILHSIKSFTSHEINKVLKRSGWVWHEEYYDHLIRDEESFSNHVGYVLRNPQAAGLTDWRWVYLKDRASES